MFDIHTHLNDEKLFGISESIVKDLNNFGITKVIVPSCDKKMCENTLKLIEKYANVYGALGIHPCDTSDFDEEMAKMIEKSAQNPKIVAVGEIGFDNHYPGSDLIKQREVFVKQLKIAKKVKLPLILHVRDAWSEFFDVLNEDRSLFQNGVDVHCFDGGKEVAKKLLDEGFYISLTALGVEDRPKFREVAEFIPLDRVMVETDSPYLLPSELKDKQKFNVPQNVVYVAKKLAEYKKVSYEKIDEITTKNALKLFKRLGE